MKFLSEEGLDYLVSKFKSLFATESKVEHLKEKVKKINAPMQTVARKAIRLGSAGKNVRYFHKTPTIMLKESGYYMFRYYADNKKGWVYIKPESHDRKNSHAAATVGNVYQIKIGGYCWQSSFFKIDPYLGFGSYFTEVVSVEEEMLYGFACKVVTFKFTNAEDYSGCTASPYLAISKGNLVGSGMKKSMSKLFTTTDGKSYDVERYSKYQKNRIYLYVKYYKKRSTAYCPVMKDRKYHLVNRIDKNSNSHNYACIHKRGEALVKFFHRGVCVNTRHLLYFNGKTGKFRV